VETRLSSRVLVCSIGVHWSRKEVRAPIRFDVDEEEVMDFSKLKDKLTGAAEKNSDKIEQGVNDAGQWVDDKTGGKYTDKIHGDVGKAKSALDDFAGGAGSQGSGEESADRQYAEGVQAVESDESDRP